MEPYLAHSRRREFVPQILALSFTIIFRNGRLSKTLAWEEPRINSMEPIHDASCQQVIVPYILAIKACVDV